jgi:ABC-type microcin C transport system permease subunit YejE
MIWGINTFVTGKSGKRVGLLQGWSLTAHASMQGISKGKIEGFLFKEVAVLQRCPPIEVSPYVFYCVP